MIKSVSLFLLGSALVFGIAHSQEKRKWSPPPVAEVAAAIDSGDVARASSLIRASFGAKTLVEGKHWIEGSRVLWTIESEVPVSVFHEDGSAIAALKRLDDRNLQAAVVDVGNPIALNYVMKPAGATGAIKIEFYPSPPEASYREGVPRGKLFRHSFNESRIYPTTDRELEVYLPAQFEPGQPASLMVFQDGLRHAEVDLEQGLRAPIVMDHLIASGEMPVTVGIFINPGRDKSQKSGKPRNRSVEYDTVSDTYVTFLLEEILPFVCSTHDIVLREDPRHWAIAGGSSGCACAWTAAWHRPDKFGKVLGWVGTFVDIRGAHSYPPMIRKTERKPIRVALLGEKQDLDNQFGNWPLANLQMEAALKYKDYDYRYWWGNGFHGSKHAAAMLPEMMRWLWKDVAPTPAG